MTSTHDSCVAEIREALLTRDIRAFVASDWDAVADDFDEPSFVAYSGRDGHDNWALAYSSLAEYRDDWLSQSIAMRAAGYPDLEEQLTRAQVLHSIQIEHDHALVRKVFNGVVRGPDGELTLDWQSYYFLRRSNGRWRITGFAGYLPRTDLKRSRRLSYPHSLQHVSAGPYSPVVEVAAGRIIVLSGQGPLDDQGLVVGSTIFEQTQVTIENCRSQLNRAGAALSDVFKVNAYLSDLSDWDSFNQAYASLMPSPFPVRATVGVGLLLGMKVEIEMWAAP